MRSSYVLTCILNGYQHLKRPFRRLRNKWIFAMDFDAFGTRLGRLWTNSNIMIV